MYDAEYNSNSTIYSVGHSNRDAIRNIIRTNDNGKTWQQCMTYNSEEDNSFFFDATLFRCKIWIYDFKDIVYWNINGGSTGINLPKTDHPQETTYYNLNGIKLNSRPTSGIAIEKRGGTSKLIVL